MSETRLARLSLWFETDDEGCPFLKQTKFWHPELRDGQIDAVKGRGDNAFLWDNSTKAMAVFVLEQLHWARLSDTDQDEYPIPVFDGGRGSPAQYLHQAISRHTGFRHIFGQTTAGPSLLKRLVIPSHTNANSPEKERFSFLLNFKDGIHPDNIRIFLNGDEIFHEDETQRLAHAISDGVPYNIGPQDVPAGSYTIQTDNNSDTSTVSAQRYLKSLQRRLSLPHAFMQVHHVNWRSGELHLKRDLITTDRNYPSDPSGSLQGDDLATEEQPRYITLSQHRLLNHIQHSHYKPWVWIKAEAGLGKSTLIEDLAWHLSNDALRQQGSPAERPIPILIPLSNWGDTKELISLIEDSVRPSLASEELWALAQLGGVVLLFDGFDEIPSSTQRSRFLTELNIWANNARLQRCPIVITSRPWAITNHNTGLYSQSVIKLTALSECDITHYISSYFDNTNDSHKLLQYYNTQQPHLQRILTCPLYLSLLCFTWTGDDGDSAPCSESELVDRALRELMRRRNIIESEAAMELLSYLAWHSIQQPTSHTLSARTIERHISNLVTQDSLTSKTYGNKAPVTVVKRLIDRCGILQPSGVSQYEFTHGVYKDFLAGRWMSDMDEHSIIECVVHHIWDQRWERAFYFMAYHLWMEKPSLAEHIVQLLLNNVAAGNDDVWHTLLKRSCLLINAGPNHLTPIQTLANIAYDRTWELWCYASAAHTGMARKQVDSSLISLSKIMGHRIVNELLRVVEQPDLGDDYAYLKFHMGPSRRRIGAIDMLGKLGDERAIPKLIRGI